MNYFKIMGKIKNDIYHFVEKFGETPNTIIMSDRIIREIINHCENSKTMYKCDPSKTEIMGIPVTIVFKDNIIKVGFTI